MRSSMKIKVLNDILSFKRSSRYQEYKIINKSIVAYDHCKVNCYPIMNTLLRQFPVLLQRLNVVLRHCEFLAGLALLYIHPDLKMNIEDVINWFPKAKKTRIAFVIS